MSNDPDSLLAIYLNDHLAGSTVGVELARRARGANGGSELGNLLDRLVGEIEEDRDTLAAVMDAVGPGDRGQEPPVGGARRPCRPAPVVV